MGWWKKRHHAPTLSPWVRMDAVAELCQKMIGKDGGLGIFRFVHLIALLEELGDLETITSLGSGQGYHEAALAQLYPATRVQAFDLYPPEVNLALPNLQFHTVDLSRNADSAAPADLVYSIECLEHIEDDRPVFDLAARQVKPGGWLYIQLPYANAEEQADSRLQQQEWEMFQHYRPGYDEHKLKRWAVEAGLDVVWCRSLFWFPLQTMYYCGLDRIGEAALLPHWRVLLDFARMDIRDQSAQSRAQAVGIKILARRPG